MRDYRNMLLVGVAALALAAGTGSAAAQVPNGGAQSGQQHATQPMKANSPGMQAQGQKGPNRSAENANRGRQGAGNAAGVQAQEQGKGKGGATAQNRAPSGAQQRMGRTPRQAQSGNRNSNNRRAGVAANEQRMEHGRQSTAQRQRTLRGLQGNASNQMQDKGRQSATAQTSGANVRLSQQQRTQIQHTIIDARGAPRVGHVDFDVRVGTVIPRGRIHVIPVPETLVRIEPRWRGLLYFVYADEVVIVNPHDMRIVAVLLV